MSRRREPEKPPELWERRIIAVVAAVIGAISTFACSAVLFWFVAGEPFVLFGVSVMKLLFLYAPLAVGLGSAILATLQPDWFAEVMGEIWNVTVKVLQGFQRDD